MKSLATLKAVALIVFAAALEAGFLLTVAVPPAEVLRAAQAEAAATTLVQADACAAPGVESARRC